MKQKKSDNRKNANFFNTEETHKGERERERRNISTFFVLIFYFWNLLFTQDIYKISQNRYIEGYLDFTR